jgi:hypothetical protein
MNEDSRLQRVKKVLARPPNEKELKVMASKKGAAPAAKANAAEAPAKAKKAAVDENMITLADLCKELKIQGQAARRKLRAAKLQKDGRWVFEIGSAELKKVREILTAKPKEEAEAA